MKSLLPQPPTFLIMVMSGVFLWGRPGVLRESRLNNFFFVKFSTLSSLVWCYFWQIFILHNFLIFQKRFAATIIKFSFTKKPSLARIVCFGPQALRIAVFMAFDIRLKWTWRFMTDRLNRKCLLHDAIIVFLLVFLLQWDLISHCDDLKCV